MNAAIYVVNGNHLFLVSTDSLGTFPILSGRAIATSNAFGASSLSGGFVVHLTGFDPANSDADVTLGQLNLNMITNAVSGTLRPSSRLLRTRR